MIDNKTIREFEQLKSRIRQAEEYAQTKFLEDSPEGQEKAIKTLQKIVLRMEKLWEMMSLKLEIDYTKTIDELNSDIEKYASQFLYPTRVIFSVKEQKAFIKLEPPAFWRDPLTQIINE